jgi:hypothetical protein
MSVVWTVIERRQVFEETLRDDARGLTQLAFCLCRDRTKAEDITAEVCGKYTVRAVIALDDVLELGCQLGIRPE